MLKVGDKVICLFDVGFITKCQVYTILSICVKYNTYKLVENIGTRENISYGSDCFTLCTDLTKALV
jgi:hypothetical protein